MGDTSHRKSKKASGNRNDRKTPYSDAEKLRGYYELEGNKLEIQKKWTIVRIQDKREPTLGIP